MKYYVYVSDTKVDMLYAQIPQSIKSKIATEIKIDLKIFSTTFKDKEESVKETRYSKLDIVVKYLQEHFNIGTTESPGAYFRGNMPMYWGNLGVDYQRIAYFGGRVNNTAVVLGGSVSHLLGNVGMADRDRSTSLLGQLADFFDTYSKYREETDSDETFLENLLRTDTESMMPLEYMHDAYGAIKSFELKPPKGLVRENIEFLARRLFENKPSNPSNVHMIIGSPIYVALPDEV